LGQDVTNEILKVISSGALPTGINDAYYVFTANGINVCEDQGMTHCTFSTPAQPVGFCAYHSYLQSAAVSPYALLAVNPSMPGGCQIPSFITTIFPNSDSIADSEISLTSQEQVNIQTDPFLSAWFDTTNATGEISDKCARIYGTVNATDGHNFIMNNHKYILQEEWSNVIGGCTLIPPLRASITVSLLPYAKSSTLTPNDFFPLTYAIGKQLVGLQYTGGAVMIQADPNTSLSISPMSSRSNSGLEKSCSLFQVGVGTLNLGPEPASEHIREDYQVSY
jgi:hypothetical protein